MKTDQRLEVVKVMYKHGYIKRLPDIFLYIPKTLVVTAIGASSTRFSKKLKDPTTFTLGEITLMAKAFDMPIPVVRDIVYGNDIPKKKNPAGR